MMNVLYNDYITESERDFELGLMKEQAKVDRNLLLLRTICEKEELDLREAEIRCMEESGDMYDLTNYYSEASEGNEEKKDGLLKRIADGIRKIWKRAKEFVFGKKDEIKVEPEEEIELDEESRDKFGFLKFVKDHMKGTSIALGLLTVGTAIVGTGATYAKYKKTIKGKEAIGYFEYIGDLSNKVIDSMKDNGSVLWKAVKGKATEEDLDQHKFMGIVNKVSSLIISGLKFLARVLFKKGRVVEGEAADTAANTIENKRKQIFDKNSGLSLTDKEGHISTSGTRDGKKLIKGDRWNHDMQIFAKNHGWDGKGSVPKDIRDKFSDKYAIESAFDDSDMDFLLDDVFEESTGNVNEIADLIASL